MTYYKLECENKKGGISIIPIYPLSVIPYKILDEKSVLIENYISAVLFEMNRNEYLVFGNSGKLGKYAASDQDHPQDIIGYKPILKSVVGNCFKSFESL
jgi:hypothetical protein